MEDQVAVSPLVITHQELHGKEMAAHLEAGSVAALVQPCSCFPLLWIQSLFSPISPALARVMTLCYLSLSLSLSLSFFFFLSLSLSLYPSLPLAPILLSTPLLFVLLSPLLSFLLYLPALLSSSSSSSSSSSFPHFCFPPSSLPSCFLFFLLLLGLHVHSWSFLPSSLSLSLSLSLPHVSLIPPLETGTIATIFQKPKEEPEPSTLSVRNRNRKRSRPFC